MQNQSPLPHIHILYVSCCCIPCPCPPLIRNRLEEGNARLQFWEVGLNIRIDNKNIWIPQQLLALRTGFLLASLLSGEMR